VLRLTVQPVLKETAHILGGPLCSNSVYLPVTNRWLVRVIFNDAVTTVHVVQHRIREEIDYTP
jgi:hypothetical protein